MTSGGPSTRRLSGNPALGIGYMLLGGLIMTGNNAILKALSAGYPVGEVIFMRSLFVWLPIAYFVWRAGGVSVLRVNSLGIQLSRGMCLLVSMSMYVLSLRFLPLADVTAITFSAPLFVTALAPLMLGERVGWRRWAAVAVGFCGVLVIIRPTQEALAFAALLAVGAAFWSAIRDLLTRKITANETTESILATTTGVAMMGGLLTLPFGWTVPPAFDLALMATGGILVGFGHKAMIEAFRHAEAVVVAPIRYVTIVYAIALDIVVWSKMPDQWVVLGSLIVVASGLYIFHRQVLRRPAGGG